MTGQGLRGPETRLNVFRLRLQRLRLTVRPRPRVRPSDRAAGSEGATRRQLWRSGMRAILGGSLSVQQRLRPS